MKKIYLVVLIFCFGFLNSYSQWTKCSNGLNSNNRIMEAFASEGNNLFAVSWNGGVFLSTDNGSSWTNVSKNNGMPADSIITCIAIKDNNIYVGSMLPNLTPPCSRLFLSTNNGGTWTSVANDLTVNLDAVAIKDSNIFIGFGTQGIYLSTNNGSSWTQNDNGLGSDTDIYCIEIIDTNIFAGAGFAYLRPQIMVTIGLNSIMVCQVIKWYNALSISCSNIYAATWGWSIQINK